MSALDSHADSTAESYADSNADSNAESNADSALDSNADSTADITRTPRNVRGGKGRGVRPLEKRREEPDTRDRPAADPPPAARPFESDFAGWWAGWPKKVDRKAAYQRYAARRRDGVAAAVLLTARDQYLARLTDPQYCKHGSTFLSASDGPWSEFTDAVAPDTREDSEELLPPFLALSRVEDKLRARGVPVDVERLDAVVRTFGFTGAWYDLPATLDILEAALADTPAGELTGTELVAATGSGRVDGATANGAATTVLTVAEDPPMVDNDTLKVGEETEDFGW
jgi:hypothetical protein